MSREHIIRTANTDVGIRLTSRLHPHGLVSARTSFFHVVFLSEYKHDFFINFFSLCLVAINKIYVNSK